MFSVIVDTNGHKRGPTFRHVVGVEIQRDCNFEAHLYHFGYRLGCMSNHWFILSSQLPYSRLGQLIVISFCLVISIASYATIFRALSHHQAQIQDHVQEQSSQPNVPNMAQYRKVLHSVRWVQLALVVCYVPYFTVERVISLRKERFPNFIIIRGIAVVLVFFNSTLNPFLYCWKISEVRRAVKQTIRQAICHAHIEVHVDILFEKL